MKISLNWLKDYVEFDDKFSLEEIVWRLTEATAEIEGVIDMAKELDKVVIGHVKKLEKHPDADKLKVAQVDVGTETLKLVCAGVNLKDGMTVAISLPGAMVRWHGEGELVEVKKVKLRGVESTGMICASSEIGLAGFFPDEGDQDISDFSSYDAKPGQSVAEVLMLDDHVFEVDNHSITHRPDLFSHYGFARECVALGLAKWKKQLQAKDPKTLTGKTPLPVKPEFKNDQCSKNYYSTVIKGVSTKESPLWLKSRLSSIGIRSINAIVDATNLIMMETGQPNHAFDLRLIEGKDFTHRLSNEGEKVTTLDGVERKLEKDIIIVESGKEIIDLCGVMGGENSAIKDDTTDLYLHVCHYDNVLVRKAMISLGHRTDAGTIFEKNIEPERAALGFTRAIQVFKELFPEANFDSETFHYHQEDSPIITVELPFKKVASHIGLEINSIDGKQYLEDLGFTVKLNKDSYQIGVPSWRANGVTIPEDVIEEIVRIHGLSKIPNTPPVVELMTPVKNHKRHTKRTIQQFLTGQGFQEEANFSFLSEDLLGKANISNHAQLIEIANPVNEDFRFMRPNFIPYLLNNLSRNQIREMKLWKSFEMGAVYKRVESEMSEDHLLTLCIASPNKDSVFADVQTLAQSLFKELSLVIDVSPGEHPYSHPGRCIALSSDGDSVGHVYDVHPMLLENFKLKGSVTIVEIQMDRLYKLSPEDVLYSQINRNPKALLDINVVVNEDKMVSEVEALISSVEAEYLSSSELVDVYQGESLGEGKKSFTFTLSYQHPDRTLEEKEIQDILEKLIKKLEKEGGVVRR
jgi:phenylalanyl-tRNA synthetase beta chain